MEAPPKGPYIQMAVFCEKVLAEQDGVPSIIRVIDQLRHRVVDPNAPDTLPPLSVRLQGFLAIKPGDAKGRFDYSITMERPDGLRANLGEGSFTFSGGPHQGVNIPLQLDVVFEQAGLYWFDVYVEDELLTRMPFLVEYEPVRPRPGAR